MKFSMLFALSMLAVGSVSAGEVVCGRVDEADDWYMTLNSERSLVAFFDNDHYEAMELTDMVSYETYPSQDVYTFEGSDTGAGIDVFKFKQHGERMTGSLKLADSEETIAFSCDESDDASIDWSEVQAAIKNKAKNGGSTRF